MFSILWQDNENPLEYIATSELIQLKLNKSRTPSNSEGLTIRRTKEDKKWIFGKN